MSTTEISGQTTGGPDAVMNAQPQRQHQWLHKLVGDWTFEVEAPGQPGGPPERWTGTERVRSLGGLWVVGEGQGEVPGGGTGTTIQTLGYDPQKQSFVGTWVGSMMAYLWVYEGSLNADETVLTLNSVGPNMTGGPGQLAKYREAIEFKSDAYRVFTSHMQADDGSWQSMMTAHYRRKH